MKSRVNGDKKITASNLKDDLAVLLGTRFHTNNHVKNVCCVSEEVWCIVSTALKNYNVTTLTAVTDFSPTILPEELQKLAWLRYAKPRVDLEEKNIPGKKGKKGKRRTQSTSGRQSPDSAILQLKKDCILLKDVLRLFLHSCFQSFPIYFY